MPSSSPSAGPAPAPRAAQNSAPAGPTGPVGPDGPAGLEGGPEAAQNSAPAPDIAGRLRAEGNALLARIRRGEGTPGDSARLHAVQLELAALVLKRGPDPARGETP